MGNSVTQGPKPPGKGLPNPDTLHPRVLAHLGDGVYELFLRERALHQSGDQIEQVHNYVTERASAVFQVKLLEVLAQELTDAEQEWIRRGRNVPVAVGRRNNQAVHRQANGFETLVGYLHLRDSNRLRELWEKASVVMDEPEFLASVAAARNA